MELALFKPIQNISMTFLAGCQVSDCCLWATYTAQQKFSMDFFFVLILVQIRNDFFEVINKYGNP